MKFIKISTIFMLTALFIMTANLATAQEATKAEKKISFEESEWTRRCQKDPKTQKEDKERCEISKTIKVKGGQGRVAEIAIGKNTKNNDVYSGVVIMPLGILLEEGVLLKIDDGKPVMFKPRFCAQAGCISYITLDKTLIGSMKKGNKISFVFRSSNGQKVNIDMSLSGFTKAIKSI